MTGGVQCALRQGSKSADYRELRTTAYEVLNMALTPRFLRLETRDGRAVEEYCIRDGEIEARRLRGDTQDDCEWHRLTPAQLTDHVNRNTVVARWLERRLGWRPLLRACVGEQTTYDLNSSSNAPDQHAA